MGIRSLLLMICGILTKAVPTPTAWDPPSGTGQLSPMLWGLRAKASRTPSQGGVADLVDGLPLTCAEIPATPDEQHWMAVDIRAPVSVASVTITPDNIGFTSAEVRIGNVEPTDLGNATSNPLCTTFDHLGTSTFILTCNGGQPVAGQYIVIIQSIGATLSICGIEPTIVPVRTPWQGPLGQTLTARVSQEPSPPSSVPNLIDNDEATCVAVEVAQESVRHWMAIQRDEIDDTVTSQVTIRTGSVGLTADIRIGYFEPENIDTAVSGELCASIRDLPAATTRTFTCENLMVGDYFVIVQPPNANARLELCEVTADDVCAQFRELPLSCPVSQCTEGVDINLEAICSSTAGKLRNVFPSSSPCKIGNFRVGATITIPGSSRQCPISSTTVDITAVCPAATLDCLGGPCIAGDIVDFASTCTSPFGPPVNVRPSSVLCSSDTFTVTADIVISGANCPASTSVTITAVCPQASQVPLSCPVSQCTAGEDINFAAICSSTAGNLTKIVPSTASCSTDSFTVAAHVNITGSGGLICPSNSITVNVTAVCPQASQVPLNCSVSQCTTGEDINLAAICSSTAGTLTGFFPPSIPCSTGNFTVQASVAITGSGINCSSDSTSVAITAVCPQASQVPLLCAVGYACIAGEDIDFAAVCSSPVGDLTKIVPSTAPCSTDSFTVAAHVNITGSGGLVCPSNSITVSFDAVCPQASQVPLDCPVRTCTTGGNIDFAAICSSTAGNLTDVIPPATPCSTDSFTVEADVNITGSGLVCRSTNITVAVAECPPMALTCQPSSCTPGQNINFTRTCSANSTGSLNVTNSDTPCTNGNYEVTGTVNISGVICPATSTTLDISAECPPIALTCQPSSCTPGQNINFTRTCSANSTGSLNVTNSDTPCTNGNYEVTGTVNISGVICPATSTTLDISAECPPIALTCQPSSCTPGQNINFTRTCSANSTGSLNVTNSDTPCTNGNYEVTGTVNISGVICPATSTTLDISAVCTTQASIDCTTGTSQNSPIECFPPGSTLSLPQRASCALSDPAVIRYNSSTSTTSCPNPSSGTLPVVLKGEFILTNDIALCQPPNITLYVRHAACITPATLTCTLGTTRTNPLVCADGQVNLTQSANCQLSPSSLVSYDTASTVVLCPSPSEGTLEKVITANFNEANPCDTPRLSVWLKNVCADPVQVLCEIGTATRPVLCGTAGEQVNVIAAANCTAQGFNVSSLSGVTGTCPPSGSSVEVFVSAASPCGNSTRAVRILNNSPCPAGSGGIPCTPCGIGTYNPGNRSLGTECILCSPGTTTSGTASTSEEQCIPSAVADERLSAEVSLEFNGVQACALSNDASFLNGVQQELSRPRDTEVFIKDIVCGSLILTLGLRFPLGTSLAGAQDFIDSLASGSFTFSQAVTAKGGTPTVTILAGLRCPPGFGGALCTRCKIGFYSAGGILPQVDTCQQCPDGKTTTGSGAQSVDECGYFCAKGAQILGRFQQCGGLGSSCGVDGPCEASCCVAGFYCKRLDSWHHECWPRPCPSTSLLNQQPTCGTRWWDRCVWCS